MWLFSKLYALGHRGKLETTLYLHQTGDSSALVPCCKHWQLEGPRTQEQGDKIPNITYIKMKTYADDSKLITLIFWLITHQLCKRATLHPFKYFILLESIICKDVENTYSVRHDDESAYLRVRCLPMQHYWTGFLFSVFWAWSTTAGKVFRCEYNLLSRKRAHHMYVLFRISSILSIYLVTLAPESGWKTTWMDYHSE